MIKEISFFIPDDQYQYTCIEICQQFLPEFKILFEEPAIYEIEAKVLDQKLTLAYREKNQTKDLETYGLNSPLNKEMFRGFLYAFFCKKFHKQLEWGLLTGVKPVKRAHQLLASGLEEKSTVEKLKAKYKMTTPKAQLITQLAQNEMQYMYPINPKKISLYIGIPICFSKCTYCSFVTTVAKPKEAIIEQYHQHLLEEIKLTGECVHQAGFKIDTLYIGGGTPSILSAQQIDLLFNAIEAAFDLSELRELSFESGRPETTTIDRLEVLKKHHVTRLCLNPQSMNQSTLLAINRHYAPEEILEKYALIQSYGFKKINMDLILGLNHESQVDFLKSLKEIIQLKPSNLTIHSLAIKKGAAMRDNNGVALETIDTLYSKAFYDTINHLLEEAAYHPYYLYRQKYTAANGENTGYAQEGQDCIYNMLMMAEKQTILGIGAGSSGKVYFSADDRFEKIFTVKDVRTYNLRAAELIQKKINCYKKLFNLERQD